MKNSDNLLWSPATTAAAPQFRSLPKLLIFLTLFLSVTYIVYTLKILSSDDPCPDADQPITLSTQNLPISSSISSPIRNQTIPNFPQKPHIQTEIQDIVFGIAASANLWETRKEYIKLWFDPRKMRAVVWMDEPVATKTEDSKLLPPVVVSGDAGRFAYRNKQGRRSAIRISRIVGETVRLGAENVRWVVMGDDDTVFVAENLVRVLRKYDHNGFYYIGSSSESHLQNIHLSYGMAYGGGGFAISYPLAKAIEKMQDGCLERYPGLYGSDDRIQACMAELGVPLTKELGFHQYDVYGNLFGLLAAHPVTPLVSLHHLDIVEPIFPDTTRLEALRRLLVPMWLDSAALMQQSICYDKARGWTISLSWGFTVQIFRGVFLPREMEMPSRTFLNWYRKADYTAYAFNTRPVTRNPCQKPFIFYFSNGTLNSSSGLIVTEYLKDRSPHPFCKWKMADPALLQMVMVFKKPNPSLWDSAPRRNCCRVMGMEKEGVLSIDVGTCREGEISI
ncbi:fringe-related family protein [Cucumis melo var. makuwa]|uniref:Fringe-related family protein n=2 Tax=Cucumis melo TaxID=3656 RepID=A0A5A7TMU7_CUCMM|nr:uncharacterized protein LOC103493168 [Cucumis melo]KAA0044823.1 fringe-related family protein [Cucumis melo var. makuwa]